MLALFLSVASLAMAAEPVAVVWPHETRVVSDSGQTDSIAVIVHCFPPKAKYPLDGQTAEVAAFASAIAPRVDKVVLMENPSAGEVREQMKSLVLEGDAHYKVGYLALAGNGFGGDIGNPRLACRDWTHTVENASSLPSGDAYPAAFAAAVKPHDDQETLTLAELTLSMQTLATMSHAVFDTSFRIPLPDEELSSVGPTASDWTLGLAISAGAGHSYTGRGFLAALTNAIDQAPPGRLTLGALTVATRHLVLDPTVPVATHGDLAATFFDSAPSVPMPDPTIVQGRNPIAIDGPDKKPHRPIVRPVVRWTGIGIGVAALGASAYTYSVTQEIGPTLDDAAPDNYATREEALIALGKYNVYRGLTYGLYALGGVGLTVGGLTFVVGPNQATLSGSF